MPSTYFYLRNAKLQENAEDMGLENNIYLSGRQGECFLAFINDKIMKEWSAKIQERMYEMSSEVNPILGDLSQPKVSHKKKSLEN
mmetsp:Transcript_20907/g.19958  ORF Transcript_20907/g.19958 Transcript_20907/m.19958 type:complete len:85 (-) Transcript_20907:32-286(-)